MAQSIRVRKVYGWLGWRSECLPSANGSQQTREVVAALSQAAAARAFGCSMSSFKRYGGETGNVEELRIAFTKPGVVFWKKLDGCGNWREG